MKRFLSALIILAVVFIGANTVQAFHVDMGEVDSSGSFTFPVFCLTAAGLDTTADSISIRIYKRTDGDSVKTDDQTDLTPVIGTLTATARTTANHPRYHLKLTTHSCIFFAQTPTPDSMFTGTYSGVVYMTVGTNVTTATTFTFSPVDRANGHGMQGIIVQYWAPYNDRTPTAIVEGQPADIKAKTDQLTFTVANEVNANMRYYEGADGVDVEIESEVSDGVRSAIGDTFNVVAGFVYSDVKAVGSDAIVDNGDGRLEVNAEEWHDGQIPTQNVTGTPEVDITNWASVATDASDVALTDASTLAMSIADSVWEESISGHKKDSVFGGAYGYVVGGTRAVVIADFDSAVGTLANSQVDDDISVGSVAGLADTMRDVLGDTLNASSGKVYVAFVDGLGDTLRDVIGDTLNATSGKVYVALVDGLGDTLRDVIGDTLNATSGKVYVAFVDGLGDTLRDVVGDTLNATSGKVYVALVDGLADTVRDVLGDTVNAISGKLLTDAGDSIRAHAPHGNNWASTGAGGSGSCTGAGSQTDSLFALDTSGTDALVSQALVSVWTAAAMTGDPYAKYPTATSGFVVLNLEPSTTYYYSVTRQGYTFPTGSFTTGSGGLHKDTLKGYDIAISSPGAANLKRLYDDIYTITGDSIQGAVAVVELLVPDSTIIPYDTVSGFSLGKNPAPQSAVTAASGRFTIDVTPNNYIRPANTRYRVSVYANRRQIYSVVITATGTTTAQVRTLQ